MGGAGRFKVHSCSSEVLNLKVPSRCTSITIRDRLCSSSQKLERLEQLMVGDSRGQRLDDGSVLETRLPFFRIHKAEIWIVKSRTGRVRRTGWQFYRKAIGRITTIIGERCPTNVAGTPITITSGSVWVSARLGGNLKASYR